MKVKKNKDKLKLMPGICCQPFQRIPDQLIFFWGEGDLEGRREVVLENVELILEAFDYLQLPFAIKNGRIGRMCIKIPWTKLGWDPIIISLDDVFICTAQRDDSEWSPESVESREFAGKKAKLAAAELAKLTRRVCDNQSGQSFISYMSAKILDNVQVSVQRLHVTFVDGTTDSDSHCDDRHQTKGDHRWMESQEDARGREENEATRERRKRRKIRALGFGTETIRGRIGIRRTRGPSPGVSRVVIVVSEPVQHSDLGSHTRKRRACNIIVLTVTAGISTSFAISLGRCWTLRLGIQTVVLPFLIRPRKIRGGQVCKRLDISEFGIYWNPWAEFSSSSIADFHGSQSHCGRVPEIEEYKYIIKPFDATISLMVNKSGKFEKGIPHYCVIAPGVSFSSASRLSGASRRRLTGVSCRRPPLTLVASPPVVFPAALHRRPPVIASTAARRTPPQPLPVSRLHQALLHRRRPSHAARLTSPQLLPVSRLHQALTEYAARLTFVASLCSCRSCRPSHVRSKPLFHRLSSSFHASAERSATACLPAPSVSQHLSTLSVLSQCRLPFSACR
ncbi:Vacuolar sorting-associated protein 13a [Nymphaea thermarum]|nr:Vacuolar sorting-associated protein 13a [Nymphaea thermarum]